MRKKAAAILAALALSAWTPLAHAEQPAAEQYRQMFASGNFYLEYEDNYFIQTLGAKDGVRYTRKRYAGNGLMSALSAIFNPLGALFGGGTDKTPEVFYQDGKFYQQKMGNDGKKLMLVVSEGELSDENLNPEEGWVNIKSSLALPDAFAALAWSDPYRQYSAAVEPPRFVESTKRMEEKKEYDCDTYTSRIVTKAGTTAGEIVYRLMYEAGQLVQIETAVVENGKETKTNSLKVKKLEPVMPEDAFKIKKNTKIYAAGIGNMDDLLANPVQVGVLNESKDDSSTDETPKGGE